MSKEADILPEINEKGLREMEVEILRVDRRAFLRLGELTVEVKDYKISSSMHGRTELEITFDFDSETTGFSSKASSSKRSLQTL